MTREELDELVWRALGAAERYLRKNTDTAREQLVSALGSIEADPEARSRLSIMYNALGRREGATV